jgi:hypothetical protein
MKRLAFLVSLAAACFAADEKYDGPRPPKPDLPYLMHADNLVETEVAESREEQRKNENIYTIEGASSPARTPMAEPIFLFLSEKMAPESLEMYPLEVKNGRRQVVLSTRRKQSARPLRLSVTRLADKLFRIEVNEGLGLPNGQYAISPQNSNQVFCFEVY